jgi:5-methylcytosine-specific restriction protein A
MYKSTAWRHGRKVHLAAHPLCEPCKRAGRLTPATVVHHKIPHRGDWKLFLCRDNWESQCKACHDRASQSEERRGYDLGVAEDGWPADVRHPLNRR